MPLNATDRTDGLPVELARGATSPVSTGSPESPWNVVAYSVDLKGRKVELTREHFEQAVANFEKYPRVPIVLEHADTRNGSHPEAARARGWITALRVGSMQRNGRAVATLEAKFTLEAETRDAVNRDPPAWAYCSITILRRAVSEESGEEIGSVLLSLSLTNNPALQSLERIAASAEPQALAAPAVPAEAPMSEPIEAAVAQPVEPSPLFLEMAGRLGLAADSDDDARISLETIAHNALDTLAALGLTAATPKGEVLAKLTQLVNDAAKLEAVETELESLRADKTARDREAAEADVAALVSCGAIANDAAARAASVSLRIGQPDAFAAMFGAKLAAARKGKAGAPTPRTDAMTSRIAPRGGAPSALAFALSHSEQCDAMATTLRAADPSLSYEGALAEASRRIKNASA